VLLPTLEEIVYALRVGKFTRDERAAIVTAANCVEVVPETTRAERLSAQRAVADNLVKTEAHLQALRQAEFVTHNSQTCIVHYAGPVRKADGAYMAKISPANIIGGDQFWVPMENVHPVAPGTELGFDSDDDGGVCSRSSEITPRP